MKIFSSVICLLAIFTAVGQSPTDAELVRKIKLNKTLFPIWDQGESLRLRQEKSGNDITSTRIVFEHSSECSSCIPPDPTNEPDIKRSTKDSDIVLIGHVKRMISALSLNEAFVFTDAQIVIDEIWKSPSTIPFVNQPRVDTEITVVEPGGTVILGGHKVKTSVSNEKLLTLGHSYLMFLKYHPESDSYLPVGVDAFDLSPETVEPVQRNLQTSKSLLSSKDVFKQATHASVVRSLKENGND